jgi:transcriptional regulator with XRE-family HTH domain
MKEKDLMVCVGRAIRERRKRTGLTISRLADIVGIDPGFLAHIESGRRIPSLPTAADIAEALDITLGELFAPVPKSPVGTKEELAGQMRHLFRTRTPGQREDLIVILKQLRDPKRARALRQVLGR